MAELRKAEPTQDDINLYVLNELETLNAVVDAICVQIDMPVEVVALARLRVRLKQLERQCEVAAKQEDANAVEEINTEHAEVSRQIKTLEAQVA